MIRRGALIVAAATALAGPASALPPLPKGLPYWITAERGASWSLVCKFRVMQIFGMGPVNQYAVSERGPSHGNLPSDNARCILTKTAGPGAVVLTLSKNRVVRSATAVRAGEPVRLSVL